MTFYGLTLNLAGSGYTILASSSGFVAATTSPITVVNPPATQLVVTAQPPASVAANGDFGLTVAVVDASGDLVSSFDGNVTVALAGKPGEGNCTAHSPSRRPTAWRPSRLDVDQGPIRLHAPTDSQRTDPRVDDGGQRRGRGGAPDSPLQPTRRDPRPRGAEVHTRTDTRF